MSQLTNPMPYRQWYQSDMSADLKWLLPTISSLAYLLRKKKVNLLELELIEVIPGRGYFIYPEKFTQEAIKPLFLTGL
jgi:hypothetical protein